jgi:hypothetical protein
MVTVKSNTPLPVLQNLSLGHTFPLAYARQLGPMAFLVWYGLLLHQDSKGIARIKQATLAQLLGISRTGVQRSLARLISLGLIRRQRTWRPGPLQGNTYSCGRTNDEPWKGLKLYT